MKVLIAPFNTSERAPARQLYKSIQPGAWRSHVAKVTALRGKKLGIGDQIMSWNQPKKRPHHISAQEWADLPDTVQVWNSAAFSQFYC